MHDTLIAMRTHQQRETTGLHGDQMLLDLTEDQEFFRETTARFLTEQVPPDALRSLRDDPAGFDPAYWRRGAELGWTSLLVGEEHGGGTISGAGLVDLSLVAYEFGRHAAPGPLVATNAVAATLSAYGAAPDLLAGLLSGEADRVVVRPRRRDPTAGGRRVEARREGSDLVLRGEARPVESAQQADHLLVTCRDGAGVTQVLVPAATPGVTVLAMQTADLTRRFGIVTFDDASPPARARWSVAVGEAAADVDRQFQLSLVILNAESVGAMQTGFDMTVEWAFDRYSFGRPLASYQALKHRFADMMMWLEASHAISDAACAATEDRRGECRRAGQRGQGVHRPVRHRALAGLRAAARGHRRHLRARSPPLPAALHRRPGAGRDTGGPPPADRRAGGCAGRDGGMSAVRAEQAEGTDEVEDLQSFRRRARSFIRDNLRQVTPEELRWAWTSGDEEAELAGMAREREIQRMLFDAGLAGICFPRAYGGQGLTPAHQRVLNEELVGHEYPAKMQVPTLSPCATVLLDFGTEEQKLRHIPAILRGEELWMQFLSEPSGGSDVAGALTTAVRDGDQWVLNGSKVWTTGAWWSDWGLCLARTNWDVPKHRGLTVFMLPIHQPGIEVHRIEMLNGSREFCQEFMTDVIVPDSDRVGRRGRRLDRGDPLDVPRAHAVHLALRHRAGRVDARQERYRPPCSPSPGSTGRMDDPAVRDLVGEARMLELVGQELMKRVSETIRSGAHVRSGGRRGPPVQGHHAGQDRHARLRGRGPGGGGVDGRQRGLPERGQLPDAAGGEHRRRDGGDGAQRHQRAGARHAPRAHAGPRRPVP